MHEPHHNQSTKNDYNTNEEFMREFCKQMLKSRIFIGRFQEKRYIEAINLYRDVIVLDNTENDLSNDLVVVQKRILRYLLGTHQIDKIWVGITKPDMIGAPAGYCIWTKLGDNIPFGVHRFQIKTIRFLNNEINLKLKIINDSITNSAGENDLLSASDNQENNDNFINLEREFNRVASNFTELFNIWKERFSAEFWTFMSTKISLNNTIGFMKTFTLILFTCFFGCIEIFKFLIISSIHLIDKLNGLIEVLTPILLKLIDMITKIFGGLYLLIAMVFREVRGGSRRPAPPSQPQYLQHTFEHNSYQQSPYQQQRRFLFMQSIRR